MGNNSRITKKKIPITKLLAVPLYFHAGTLAETKSRWCTGINGSQRLFRSRGEKIVLSRERFIIGKN